MENAILPGKSSRYQEGIRKRLHEYALSNPKSMNALAHEIGINPATLRDFLEDGLDSTYKCICMIEKFLKEKGIKV